MFNIKVGAVGARAASRYGSFSPKMMQLLSASAPKQLFLKTTYRYRESGGYFFFRIF
jgi:hypothetical protein